MIRMYLPNETGVLITMEPHLELDPMPQFEHHREIECSLYLINFDVPIGNNKPVNKIPKE